MASQHRHTTDDRRYTTDRIPELTTDRHFWELSETCLYMVYFALGLIFSEIRKNKGDRFIIKVSQKKNNFG